MVKNRCPARARRANAPPRERPISIQSLRLQQLRQHHNTSQYLWDHMIDGNDWPPEFKKRGVHELVQDRVAMMLQLPPNGQTLTKQMSCVTALYVVPK